MRQYFTIALIFLILSCNNKNAADKSLIQKQISDTALTETQLISQVKLAINPKYKNWVLFSNGTYIILPDSLASDKRNNALKLIREFGPVHGGSPAGDISVINLNKTEGWVVGGHYYGMYTYVHSDEMVRQGVIDPSDIDVGLYGRRKRDQDSKDLNIIFINQ